jgi:hypothetical protein
MSKQQRPIEEIAPDDFTESYPGDTIDDCLNYAHRQAPTTTPESELPKCPVCRTRRVYSKTSKETGGETVDSDYRCANRHHFDNPVYAEPFEWVDADDLEEPPLRRRLAELDDRRLAALVIYLYRPWSPTGPSYRDLGSILPYSSDWVGDRVRAWKDGEYRDLVRDPRPRVSLAIDAEEVSAE